MCGKVHFTSIPELFLVPEINGAIMKLPMTWLNHCITASGIFVGHARPSYVFDCGERIFIKSK